MNQVVRIWNGETILMDEEDSILFDQYKWYPNQKGYLRCNQWDGDRNRTPYFHRLIMNASPDQQVDHINHNIYDNRKSNLRICSHTENVRNCIKKTPTKTNLKGVYHNTNSKNFRVAIRVNKKLIHIGSFENKLDAALAYNQAAIKYFGEFASLNKIEGL